MIKRLMPMLALALLGGCSSRDADLQRFIETTKQEQPGGVEPLPEVKLYENFVYAAQSLRSPFVPGGSREAGARGVRPDTKRSPEILEGFALDALKMKGTMEIGGRYYGLVLAPDGLTRKVLPGNYLGQNDGKITRIEPSKISVTEIIPDSLGGFIERDAGLALDE